LLHHELAKPIADGRTLWLCYSANFAPNWNGMKLKINPPGERYGLCLHECRLLAPGGKHAPLKSGPPGHRAGAVALPLLGGTWKLCTCEPAAK
jgi:hypothetical protein